jgi:hypothetical protein
MNSKGCKETAGVVLFVAQSLYSPGDTEEIYKIAV